MSTFRTNNDLIDFTLPKQGYAAFDAAGLKSLIIERLNSNNVFTDQNFEGSNINAFIDVVSYAYHVLLFYLNNTSNETLFSEAQIYENINRIVKSIDYNPVGTQSPALTINAQASSSLAQGTYTVPRYSSITARGVSYCFKNDVTFVKTTTDEEDILSISGKELLYQGVYKQYPEYSAKGEPNEILTLVPEEGSNIDHFSIDVYVQEGGTGGQYHQYNVTTSLFFERPNSRAVEIRLNENKRYEIKFGNNINGRQLDEQDIVYIYYLVTDGESGEIEANSATLKSVTLYASNQLSNLLSSDNIKGEGIVYMSQSEADNLLISNTEPSSKYYTGETVEDIRSNAPKTFTSQYRLVNINDYESFVRSNYSNFVADVKGIDNNTYLDTHIKYYYDLGLKSPSMESRVLYNQVQFSSSCNFNNLYLYCVPRLEKTTSITKRANYLTSAQKEVITNRMSETKTISCDPIIMDPVYVTVDFGVRGTNEQVSYEQTTYTKLMVVQDDNSRVNSNDIIQKIVTIFKNYFSPITAKIGMVIDLTSISNQILSIQGVNTFYTYRPDIGDTYVEGLSLYIWNPIYTSDTIQTTQNYALPVFKFPFFENVAELGNKITVHRQSDAIGVLGSSGTNQSGSIDMSNVSVADSIDISSPGTTQY